MEDDSAPLLKGHDSEDKQEPKLTLSSYLFRYLGLLFICLITFGSYYTYDEPAAFGAKILAPFYGVSTVSYGVLYGVYNFPNMVIVFFGGYFIDSVFGLKRGAIIFCCLVMTGQVIFAISASYKLFWLAVVGRLVFGLGGESLSVAQSTFCATWFNGRPDINLAFAITLSFSRIGSAVNLQSSPAIAKATSIPVALWFGAITCIISFIACIILCFLERVRAKKDKTAVVTNDPVSIKDILKFPPTMWLLCIAVVLFYVPLFVYITNATDFIQAKWPHFTQDQANSLISIPYYTAAASPIIGFLIDRIGRNLSFMTLAACLMTAAHVLLAFTTITPYVGMIVMGLSYTCMAASIWVTFPAIVPSKRLGSAFGLAFAFQNAFVAIFTLIIDAILEHTNNKFIYAEIIFVGCGVAGVAVHIILILIDIKHKRINVPSAVMKEKVKELNRENAPLLVN